MNIVAVIVLAVAAVPGWLLYRREKQAENGPATTAGTLDHGRGRNL